MVQRKVSATQIAVQLGRHRPTIHGETGRNFRHGPEAPMATGDWRMNARHLTDHRRKRQAKLLLGDDLQVGLIAGQRAGWLSLWIAERRRHAWNSAWSSMLLSDRFEITRRQS